MNRQAKGQREGGDEDEAPRGVGPAGSSDPHEADQRGQGAWEDPGAKPDEADSEEGEMLRRDPRERSVTREEIDEIGESGDRDPLLGGGRTGYEGDADAELDVRRRRESRAPDSEGNP